MHKVLTQGKEKTDNRTTGNELHKLSSFASVWCQKISSETNFSGDLVKHTCGLACMCLWF